MKTAMQELLGLVEQMFNNAKTIEIESSMNDVINIITQEGLPKEKEQIIDAYEDGNYDCGMGRSESEQYYNETFNTNDR
jgi:N12 class adenine-specific DNA methylase